MLWRLVVRLAVCPSSLLPTTLTAFDLPSPCVSSLGSLLDEEHRYPMRRISFQEWIQRAEEAQDATRLASLIAGAAGGISLDRLRRSFRHLPPDTLQDLLKALEASGQVIALQVRGQRVYRSTT
jgi:hypothetical protein